jgi:hypothetical protein
MFRRKRTITIERVHQIAEELRNDLDAEIQEIIEERNNTTDKDKIDNLYNYQHALEYSRMNINVVVHKIDIDS